MYLTKNKNWSWTLKYQKNIFYGIKNYFLDISKTLIKHSIGQKYLPFSPWSPNIVISSLSNQFKSQGACVLSWQRQNTLFLMVLKYIFLHFMIETFLSYLKESASPPM